MRLVTDYIMMPTIWSESRSLYCIMLRQLPIIIYIYHNVRLAGIIIMIRVEIRTVAAALNVNQFSGLIHSKPFRDASLVAAHKSRITIINALSRCGEKSFQILACIFAIDVVKTLKS